MKETFNVHQQISGDFHLSTAMNYGSQVHYIAKWTGALGYYGNRPW